MNGKNNAHSLGAKMQINDIHIDLTNPKSIETVEEYVCSGARSQILDEQEPSPTHTVFTNSYRKPHGLVLADNDLTSFVLLEFMATMQTYGIGLNTHMLQHFFDGLIRDWLKANLESLLRALDKDSAGNREMVERTLFKQKQGERVA